MYYPLAAYLANTLPLYKMVEKDPVQSELYGTVDFIPSVTGIKSTLVQEIARRKGILGGLSQGEVDTAIEVVEERLDRWRWETGRTR